MYGAFVIAEFNTLAGGDHHACWSTKQTGKEGRRGKEAR